MRSNTALATLLVLLALSGVAVAAGEQDAGKKDGGAIWFVTLGVPLLLLGALPFGIAVRSLHSRFTRSLAETLEERPVVKRLVALANIVLVAVVLAGAEHARALAALALVLLLLLFLATIFGMAAVSVHLGRRLYRDEARGESVGAFVLGWLVLSGLPLVPVLGFLFWLYLAAWGIGAFVLYPVRGREAPGES